MTSAKEALSIVDDEALAEEKLLEELENEEIPTAIREARLQMLKRQANEFQAMREKKHGQYTELAEEKQFLDITTGEELCVVHFSHADFRRCAVMDTHLSKLADKYFETKFAKIDVDKAKFFVNKLQIRVLPAVICFKKGEVVDRIIGFDDLGGSDDFRTIVLEKRLAKTGVIEAKDIEDEEEEEFHRNKSIFGREQKSNKTEDSDSENDW